ncbi:MAG: hypothetical protein ACJATD_000936 [Alloalcanivorax sp.]|jgi:hypothetical protein
MKYFALIVALLFLPSIAPGDDYAIEAEYSFGFGLPVENPEVMFHEPDELGSEAQCLSKLDDEAVAHFALAQALKYRATDVVLKCVRYWENDWCDVLYPGCTSIADIGAPKHFHVYNTETMVPKYLKFSDAKHQVLQSIIYAEGDSPESALEPAFVAQVKYNRDLFRRLLGKAMNCEEAIKSSIFESLSQRTYLSDPRSKAYKANCYTISPSGDSDLSGDKVIMKNEG